MGLKTVKERARLALNQEYMRQAVKFTTDRLRTSKKSATEEQGNWELWRERGRQIRLHTISNLDYYLNQFVENARAHGVHVHFASTAKEAVEIVLDIVSHQRAKTVVKSKSMVSEEIHLNEALEQKGIETLETDLGEYIIQLAGESPSHIIIPAIHKNREEIAEILSKEAGRKLSPDTSVLAEFIRTKLREKFLQADIGLTGCNFAIAESGTVVLFENEGNVRMVSTLPQTLITLMGMERIIPTWEDLEVLATLLPRSATGQKLTVYMSAISGPRRATDGDGPEEMHIIILDNGRSLQLGDPEFQELLHCIRCGACLNVCPVYRQIGGHAYGSVYSGPIGAVLTPALNQEQVKDWGDLAYASSLCAACYEACPVKIPLHDMLVYLRRRKVESGSESVAEQIGMKAFGAMMANHLRYEKLLKLLRWGQKFLAKLGIDQVQIGPLKEWNSVRTTPVLAKQSFRELWKNEQLNQEAHLPPDIKKRLENALKDRGN